MITNAHTNLNAERLVDVLCAFIRRSIPKWWNKVHEFMPDSSFIFETSLLCNITTWTKTLTRFSQDVRQREVIEILLNPEICTTQI